MNSKLTTATPSLVLLTAMILGLSACGGGRGGTGSDNNGSGNTPVPPPVTPTLNLTANSSTTAVGSTISLSWTGVSVSNCVASGDGFSGSVNASGSMSVTPTVATPTSTYTITCDANVFSTSVNVLPQYTSVPDRNFQSALAGIGMAVSNGQIKTANALKITDLSISGAYATAPQSYKGAFYYTGTQYIKDATGIEAFANLTSLRFENQQVPSFNLANLTQLTFLSLWAEPITTIDLSHNTALQTLGLSETSLTSVDTSALTKLTELDFEGSGPAVPYTTINGTTVPGNPTLNLQKNTALFSLYIQNNGFTAIDLSGNKALSEIWAGGNKFTSLDFTGFTALSFIQLNNNPLLTSLNLTGIANGGVPAVLNTINDPLLATITVNSVSAYKAATTQVFVDQSTTFIGGQ